MAAYELMKELVMAPTANISDATNARLQAIATPLVDTHNSVIERLLDHWEATHASQPVLAKPGEPIKILDGGRMKFSPANLPSLGFTTCQQIIIDDVQLPKNDTYWNSLLTQTIRQVHAKGVAQADIMAMLTVANAVIGEKNDNGYKFIPDIGISVQGQDSNGAFRQAYQLAVLSGLKGSVFFAWQMNPKAAYPGQGGYVEF